MFSGRPTPILTRRRTAGRKRDAALRLLQGQAAGHRGAGARCDGSGPERLARGILEAGAASLKGGTGTVGRQDRAAADEVWRADMDTELLHGGHSGLRPGAVDAFLGPGGRGEERRHLDFHPKDRAASPSVLHTLPSLSESWIGRSGELIRGLPRVSPRRELLHKEARKLGKPSVRNHLHRAWQCDAFSGASILKQLPDTLMVGLGLLVHRGCIHDRPREIAAHRS